MNPAPARLLQIYVSESSQFKHQALYVALTKFLKDKGLAAVTVRRGFMGYGSTGILHEPRLCPVAGKLPIILECIDSPERIDKVLPEVREMNGEGICLIMDGFTWTTEKTEETDEKSEKST